MRHGILVGVLMMVLGFALVPGAHAQTMRHPKTGEPALVLDVPAGWTTQYDSYGNLQFSSANRVLNLQLTMLDDAPESTSLPDLATAICKEGGLPLYTRSGPGTIAERTGQAFYMQKTYPNGAVIDFTMVLVRVNATTVATMTRVVAHNRTSAQDAELNGVVAKVRLAGAR